MESFINATGQIGTVADKLVAAVSSHPTPPNNATTNSDGGRSRPKRNSTPPSSAPKHKRQAKRPGTSCQEPGKAASQRQRNSPVQQYTTPSATYDKPGVLELSGSASNPRSPSQAVTPKSSRAGQATGPSYRSRCDEGASATHRSTTTQHSRSSASRRSMMSTMPSTAPSTSLSVSTSVPGPVAAKTKTRASPTSGEVARRNYACPFDKRGLSTSSEHVLNCKGGKNSGFEDMGRIRYVLLVNSIHMLFCFLSGAKRQRTSRASASSDRNGKMPQA